MLNNQLVERIVVYWAVLMLPFITKVPLMEFTLVGKAFRLVVLLLLFCFLLIRINKSLGSYRFIEGIFIFYMISIIAASTVSGVVGDRYAEFAMMAKFVVINLSIYTIAISLNSVKSILQAFRLYYGVCCFAACQAVFAMVADAFGVRALMEIPLSDGRAEYTYYLSWFGVLGGDLHNNRANFYFAESSHFAHFLFPGIAYAFAERKKWGLLLLLAGFASTFAGAASFALIMFVILFYVRTKDLKGFLFLTLVLLLGGVAFYFYAVSDAHLFARLFHRTQSIEDKTRTYAVAFQWLMNYPLGSGIFETSKYFGSDINTSGGLFNWVLWFGWLAIPAVFFLLAPFVYLSFRLSATRFEIAFSLGLFFMTVATISHGPLPKYYMVFLYGIFFRYCHIVRRESQRKDLFRNRSDMTENFEENVFAART